MSSVVDVRQCEPGDEELLFRVYASTRAEELAVVPWDEAQKYAFVRAQFDAQDRWYREHYAAASFDVVLIGGEPGGRLYVHRGESEIRIVDIALLPQHRGSGVGTALLRELLAEADADGKRVTIHVERFNPALRLYERLGFSVAEDKGVFLLLERSPPARTRPRSGPMRSGRGRSRSRQSLVLDAVDPLRQRRVGPASEDD